MSNDGKVRLDSRCVPILFVCGLHRSGTTALANVLGSAPGVRALSKTGAPADEGQHLQRSFNAANAHGGPGLFAFDPATHLTEHSPLATSSIARAVLDTWTPHWHLNANTMLSWGAEDGTAVLLEKSPPNLVRTRFLQALFPQARFVVLRRHPAVVAVSTSKMCPDRSVEKTLRHWLIAHSRYEADAPRIRRVHEMRYEDLLVDPAGTLHKLAEALQIDSRFDLSLLDIHRTEPHLRVWQETAEHIPSTRLRQLDAAFQRYGYRLDEPFVLPTTAVYA